MVSPKSLRLILPSALKPARVFPIGSLGRTPLNVPVSTIGFVTPRSVKSPMATYWSPCFS